MRRCILIVSRDIDLQARRAPLMAVPGHLAELADSAGRARRLLADKTVALATVHPMASARMRPTLLGECRDPHGPTMYAINVSWAHYLAGGHECAMASMGVMMDYQPLRAAILVRLSACGMPEA